MKNIILTLGILILLPFASFSQRKVLKECEQLINNRQYNSAMGLLDREDPENENPTIVLAKCDLVLEYFCQSIMHQMFALKDLEPGEDLIDLRINGGQFGMFLFSPDSILSNLIEQHPDNYELYKMLGRFFYEIHLKYSPNWLISDQEVLQQVRQHYLIAYQHEVYDDWSLYGLGYTYLLEEAYETAINFFSQSIELEPTYPTSHYNLAYAYLSLNQRDSAIESAKSAFNLYEEPELKGDAARLVGITFSELEKYDSAVVNLQLADQINPKNYYTLRALLKAEMSLESEKIPGTAATLLHLDPDNPTIYQTLGDIFWNQNRLESFTDFLEREASTLSGNKEALGCLYFHLANAQIVLERTEEARQSMQRAKELFGSVFAEDHPVFEQIDQFLSEFD